jgi:hypothetical protein
MIGLHVALEDPLVQFQQPFEQLLPWWLRAKSNDLGDF